MSSVPKSPIHPKMEETIGTLVRRLSELETLKSKEKVNSAKDAQIRDLKGEIQAAQAVQQQIWQQFQDTGAELKDRVTTLSAKIEEKKSNESAIEQRVDKLNQFMRQQQKCISQMKKAMLEQKEMSENESKEKLRLINAQREELQFMRTQLSVSDEEVSILRTELDALKEKELDQFCSRLSLSLLDDSTDAKQLCASPPATGGAAQSSGWTSSVPKRPTEHDSGHFADDDPVEHTMNLTLGSLDEDEYEARDLRNIKDENRHLRQSMEDLMTELTEAKIKCEEKDRDLLQVKQRNAVLKVKVTKLCDDLKTTVQEDTPLDDFSVDAAEYSAGRSPPTQCASTPRRGRCSLGAHIDGESLKIIQRKLGTSWKTLARALGFDKGTIDAIEVDNREYGLDEMVSQCLTRWQEREGHGATLEKMVAGLREAGRADIAAELL